MLPDPSRLSPPGAISSDSRLGASVSPSGGAGREQRWFQSRLQGAPMSGAAGAGARAAAETVGASAGDRSAWGPGSGESGGGGCRGPASWRLWPSDSEGPGGLSGLGPSRPLGAPASPSDRTLPSCCREESPRVSGSEPVLAASGVAAAGFLGAGHILRTVPSGGPQRPEGEHEQVARKGLE